LRKDRDGEEPPAHQHETEAGGEEENLTTGAELVPEGGEGIEQVGEPIAGRVAGGTDLEGETRSKPRREHRPDNADTSRNQSIPLPSAGLTR